MDSSGNAVLTTQYPHDLTTTPALARAKPWNEFAKLAGFGSAILDGTKQLIDVPDRNTLIVGPSAPIGAITLDGDEVLLEKLEREIVGGHDASVATGTTLTFTTPSAITRNYTITSPVVATNIRCFGVASTEAAVQQFVNDDNSPVPANRAHLFVSPIEVKTSRSKNAQLDGISEITDAMDYRLTMIDGFEVLVVLPAQDTPGGLTQADLAHGPVFAAILKTFFGLQIPRPELCGSGSYVAILKGHGLWRYDGANYMHKYDFEVMASITNADAIAPYDWPDVDPDNISPTLLPVGALPLRDIEFSESYGIKHDGKPGILTGKIKMD